MTGQLASRMNIQHPSRLHRLSGTWRIAPIISMVALAVLAVEHSANALADEHAGQAPVNVAMCRGCHGIAGYRSAFPEVYPVPKLGGQQAAYIVNALQQYRSGLRKHATMRSIAATLTDQQIAAIAAYYASGDK